MIIIQANTTRRYKLLKLEQFLQSSVKEIINS